MLIPQSQIKDTPVMSLHTGARAGRIDSPLIDPRDLRVVAYQIKDSPGKQAPTFLMMSDVREISSLGMIIDDADDLVEVGDVIKLDELYELKFYLIGKPVIEEQGKKIGKIEEYSLDTNTFMIHKLHVKQGLLKSLNGVISLIDRSQIVEVNDHAVIVKTTAERKHAEVERVSPAQANYVNPFRKPVNSPQPEAVQN